MHMAVSPDHRLLYASIRSEPYSAITYLINPQTGILTQMAKVSLPANMVYISVDKTRRFLLSTSYNEAMIAVNLISPDGTAQPNPVQIISTGKKPHSIRSDLSNRFVYVPHLGTSQIKQFLFNEKNGLLCLMNLTL
jgi:6-phosphogluconolactonase